MSEKKIEAKILADSVSATTGHRITTFLCTYPRFIHEEMLTHRALSRNTASSRAIPVQRLVEMVRESPAMPVWWGKNQAGMQAGEELTGWERLEAERYWHDNAKVVAHIAESAASFGLHKQLANRWLHPVQWCTSLVTATEWDGFWRLRANPAAQPEFQELAYEMLAAYLAGEPAEMDVGQWHMPFGERMEGVEDIWDRLKIATARVARLSYLTHNGDYSTADDARLHNLLLSSGHWSPFEHCATPFDGVVHPWEATRNFTGWVPYREYVEAPLPPLSRQALEAILASRPVRNPSPDQ